MLMLIIVIGAACLIDRIWPTGIVFLVIYACVATPVGMAIKASSIARFGETVDWSAASIATNMATTFAMAAVIFLITFGIRRMTSKGTREGPGPQ